MDNVTLIDSYLINLIEASSVVIDYTNISNCMITQS